jgi:hypothetical protein
VLNSFVNVSCTVSRFEEIFLAFVLKLTSPIRVSVAPKAKLEANPDANCFSKVKSGLPIDEDSSNTFF